MARPSTKSDDVLLAELEAKKAKILERKSNSAFASNSLVTNLISERDTLDKQLGMAKQGLFSSVPNYNLAMRAKSAKLRLISIQAQAKLSEVVLRFAGIKEAFLNSILGEVISKLGKEESNETVSIWISEQNDLFREKHSEIISEYDSALANSIEAEQNLDEFINEKKTSERAPRGRRVNSEGVSEQNISEIMSEIME